MLRHPGAPDWPTLRYSRCWPATAQRGAGRAGPTAIDAGGSHTCAVADAKANCWGFDLNGRVGNGTSTATISSVPVAVDISGPLAGRTVTAGDAAVTVAWTPPTDDGGSPVLDYAVTATPGGATCTASSASCAVTSPTSGIAYTFTVTSRNAIGTSAPSGPSAPVTPTASATVTPTAPVTAPVKAPGKVKTVSVKTRLAKGKVTVTWKRAARATSYRVRISKPSGKKFTSWKKTTKPKKVFKTTLRKGNKYRVKVRAVGPGGRGPITTERFRAR